MNYSVATIFDPSLILQFATNHRPCATKDWSIRFVLAYFTIDVLLQRVQSECVG